MQLCAISWQGQARRLLCLQHLPACSQPQAPAHPLSSPIRAPLAGHPCLACSSRSRRSSLVPLYPRWGMTCWCIASPPELYTLFFHCFHAQHIVHPIVLTLWYQHWWMPQILPGVYVTQSSETARAATAVGLLAQQGVSGLIPQHSLVTHPSGSPGYSPVLSLLIICAGILYPSDGNGPVAGRVDLCLYTWSRRHGLQVSSLLTAEYEL